MLPVERQLGCEYVSHHNQPVSHEDNLITDTLDRQQFAGNVFNQTENEDEEESEISQPATERVSRYGRTSKQTAPDQYELL